MERTFGTVDGDFNSQLLYVLDSTENPEKGEIEVTMIAILSASYQLAFRI